MATETNRPKIQVDDEVRDMTDDELAALLESGWTLEPTDETLRPHS